MRLRARPPGLLPAVTAGFVSVLVGVTSSVAIVFQAAHAAGATPRELGSWLLALCVGMGVTTMALSVRYRVPVVIAWSTPGTALLATSLQGSSMRVAVGAFLVSALLITVAGVTGLFERLMNRVPLSLAAALLGGVLLHFGLRLFDGLRTDAALVLPMIAAYLACRRWLPRYAVMLALAAGVVAAAVTGQLHTARLHVTLAEPVFVRPAFTWQAVVGIAVPLFIVTMASQNIPGVAAIRSAGYSVPISRVITVTGAATLLLAPFGAFALNLAAITAAICLSEEAHPTAAADGWQAWRPAPSTSSSAPSARPSGPCSSPSRRRWCWPSPALACSARSGARCRPWSPTPNAARPPWSRSCSPPPVSRCWASERRSGPWWPARSRCWPCDAGAPPKRHPNRSRGRPPPPPAPSRVSFRRAAAPISRSCRPSRRPRSPWPCRAP